MEVTYFKMLLIASASVGLLGKYVYVLENKTWPEAQKYCREHYTDLAPISSERDVEKLRDAAGADLTICSLIGLHRDPVNSWKWSGGGNASSYLAWCDGQPDNFFQFEYAIICLNACGRRANGSYNVPYFMMYKFFCLNVIVVRERKTWEEALEHCRDNHADLASLTSETEVLLARREIQEEETIERVWTGLRYLADQWLWVNGDDMQYEAWSQGTSQHQCPTGSHLCGAMTKEGLWENWDCKERLDFICY